MAPALTTLTLATSVFSNQTPPPPLVERIGQIAPRPVFLIYADPGDGGEKERQPGYYAAAGEPKQLWKVPGASHTAASTPSRRSSSDASSPSWTRRCSVRCADSPPSRP